MTFYKISSSSKAHAGGLCAARLELSPWPSTARVATWGRRFGVNVDCRLGFDCPRYTAADCIGFSTVLPSVVFHPASRSFHVRFPFIDNFLIDPLVGFCLRFVSNLPRRCHRPFFLHLSFPRLFLLIVRLFLSGVLLFYTLGGYSWL